MRLQPDQRLPDCSQDNWPQNITTRLYEIFRGIATYCNLAGYWDGEGTTAPTTGSWSQSDMYRNTTPSEAGSAGSKYVVIGWVCTASGTPGTWLPMRTLTGN